MTITDDEANLIIGALNTLGVALADHGHTWTDGERAIYEESIFILQPKTTKENPKEL
jgi:hypothetical protein